MVIHKAAMPTSRHLAKTSGTKSYDWNGLKRTVRSIKSLEFGSASVQMMHGVFKLVLTTSGSCRVQSTWSTFEVTAMMEQWQDDMGLVVWAANEIAG